MNRIAETAKIYPLVKMGRNVTIEDFCIIGAPFKGHAGEETVIGDNAVIRSHTVIYAGTVIGNDFQTGNKANIRELNNIGNDVSIGTLTVLEASYRDRGRGQDTLPGVHPRVLRAQAGVLDRTERGSDQCQIPAVPDGQGAAPGSRRGRTGQDRGQLDDPAGCHDREERSCRRRQRRCGDRRGKHYCCRQPGALHQKDRLLALIPMILLPFCFHRLFRLTSKVISFILLHIHRFCGTGSILNFIPKNTLSFLLTFVAAV